MSFKLHTPNNYQTHNLDQKQVLMITGFLGSGKTTFLVNLLKWIQKNDIPLPQVIVNDRGQLSNMDHSIVTQAISGLEAYDLHGQCIGCEGREDFISIIESTREKLFIVEPTGMFGLDELNGMNPSVSASFKALHLLPAHKIESAILGTENIHSPFLKGIGITHITRDFSSEIALLQAAIGKPIFQISQDLPDQTMEDIWDLLTKPSTTIFTAPRVNNYVCTSDFKHGHQCGHGCTHHSHDHEHTHHHEGEPFTTTFSTKGKTLSQVLAYLLSLGDNLVRFKGCIDTDNGKIKVDYAHGTWTQVSIDNDTPLKADLFTEHPVEQIKFEELTDKAIAELSDGIPQVYTHIPNADFDILEPVGPTAWGLLYEQSQNASPETRKACGIQLVERCMQALTQLDSDRLNPTLLDFYRTQIAMLWAFWNVDFGLNIDLDQRNQIQLLLGQINPNNVNQERLAEWIWEDGPDFKKALQNLFPLESRKILHFFE
jgi:G3E family GTPase